MASDEDRIAYLQGELAELDDDAHADLAELRQLLAEPAMWETPGDDVENAVVQAITAERAAGGSAPIASPAPRRESRTRRRWMTGVLAGAAAAAIVLVAVLVVRGPTSDPDGLQSALAAPEGTTDIVGAATFTRFDSGWQIEFDAPNLPRLDDGQFYQAWLKNDEGVTVPVGTFNEGDDVVLWAGVSPRNFSTITVTAEQADGDQDSSGELVLAGPITD